MTKSWRAIAWEKWMESDEGGGCLKTDGFIEARQWEYLKNRVWRAFTAGMYAAEKHYRETE